jgi:hypothetical protein
VIIHPRVSEGLGGIVQREPLLRILNRIYEQLEAHYDRYRGRRNQVEPDDYFEYPLYLADENDVWHTFVFLVNDRQADGFLFVVSLGHRLGKIRLR